MTPPEVTKPRYAQEAPGPASPKAELTPGELLEAIREDYVDRNYLWSGDIQPEIYEDACR